MRELLQAAETVVDEYKGVPSSHFHSLLVKLEEAIAAAKERSRWVKVSDGLPVVPEGKFSVRIWAFRADKGKVFRANWWQHYGFQKINFTHWQYRQDDTPAPPEAE